MQWNVFGAMSVATFEQASKSADHIIWLAIRAWIFLLNGIMVFQTAQGFIFLHFILFLIV
jgi:hypothetical protein